MIFIIIIINVFGPFSRIFWFFLYYVQRVMFIWLVYTFCRPGDQYLSCVLTDYYFVFIRIVRRKVIWYLYYDLSNFFYLEI